MAREGGIATGRPVDKSSDTTDFSLQTADTDGIKASFTTQDSEQLYEGSALDGALMTDGQLTATEPRNVTVTLAAQAGAYTAGGVIEVSGWHPDGGRQNESLVIQGTDGETLTGAKMFDGQQDITVRFPAMPNTNGSATVGVGVARAINPSARWLWVNATGTLYVHLAADGNKVSKFVIDTTGPKPIGADAIHASSDITDLVPAV